MTNWILPSGTLMVGMEWSPGRLSGMSESLRRFQRSRSTSGLQEWS